MSQHALAATDTAPAWGMDFVCGGFSPGTAAMPIGASPARCAMDCDCWAARLPASLRSRSTRPRSSPTRRWPPQPKTWPGRSTRLGAVRVADLKRQMSASELSRTIVRGYLAGKPAYGFVLRFDAGPVRGRSRP